MHILEKFKNWKAEYYTLLKILTVLLFAYNLLMLGYINLFQIKYHLGYDASAYYLKAFVMWQQKTFFPQLWSEQTTLYLDSAVPLAAILQSLTGNILVSYGLANFIIDLGMVITLVFIMKDLGLSRLVSLFVLNMFLCPYFTMQFNNANDVDWYSSLLTSGCWYGAKIFIMLLVIKTVLSLEKGKKAYALIIITMFMSLVTGISSGYYVFVTVFFPVFVYLFVRVLMKNDWKMLKCKTLYYAIVNSAIIVLGKQIAVRVIGFTSKDSNMVLTGLNDFWKNLGSIFLGFVQLVGGMHMGSDVQALTLDGITYVAGFGIIIVCLIALVYYVVKIMKHPDENGCLLVFSVFITNVVMFIVLYTTYGQPIFETRYLCILYIMLMILVGFYIEQLDTGLIWRKALLMAMFGMLAIKSFFGFGYYNQTLIDAERYDQIIAKVNKVDTPVVYVLGNELGIEGRNLRVLDTNHVYKSITDDLAVAHWGDYKYYDENGSWQGSTVIISRSEKFELLPSYIRNLYTQYEALEDYNFYKSDVNRFDYNTDIINDIKTHTDYMTSSGYSILNGELNGEDGTYTVTGCNGYVMVGPYAKVEAGIYNITFEYEILANKSIKPGRFEVTTDSGNNMVASVPLDAQTSKVMLKNVQFQKDAEGLEYKCYLENGVTMKLKSITVEVQSDE